VDTPKRDQKNRIEVSPGESDGRKITEMAVNHLKWKFAENFTKKLLIRPVGEGVREGSAVIEKSAHKRNKKGNQSEVR